MPNKTIYIRDQDIPTWQEAEACAEAANQPISQLITLAVREHLSTRDITVESVTAEVLMVKLGPLTLTQGIVGQLDKVHPDRCEPLGRLNLSVDNTYVHVIGRRVPDGALVRSGMTRPPQRLEPWTREKFQQAMNAKLGELARDKRETLALVDFMDVCTNTGWARSAAFKIILKWSDEGYIARRDEQMFVIQELPSWFMDLGPVLPHSEEELSAWAEVWDRFNSIPLIVLAD